MWHHKLVGQSLMKGTAVEPVMVNADVDVAGVADMPCAVSNWLVEWHDAPAAIAMLCYSLLALEPIGSGGEGKNAHEA